MDLHSARWQPFRKFTPAAGRQPDPCFTLAFQCTGTPIFLAFWTCLTIPFGPFRWTRSRAILSATSAAFCLFSDTVLVGAVAEGSPHASPPASHAPQRPVRDFSPACPAGAGAWLLDRTWGRSGPRGTLIELVRRIFSDAVPPGTSSRFWPLRRCARKTRGPRPREEACPFQILKSEQGSVAAKKGLSGREYFVQAFSPHSTA